MGARWGTPGPWKAQTEAAAITLNEKVVDRFLKVCTEWEGARQGAWPQCPVSPLLSPLLIFSSFFSLNLSQVFFLSLYLFSFLFSFTFYHFLLVSLFHSPFFLLTVSLSPPLPAFLTFLSPFLSRYLLFLLFLSLYTLSL